MNYNFEWQGQDGLQIFARAWQPDTSPRAVVCLVHGLGEHSGRYGHVAAALNRGGLAFLSFDQRGFGKSQGQRGHAASYEVLLDDITRLLEEASQRYPGLPRFLYGHSMGGGLALNYALRRKSNVAGIIATSPWIRLAFQPSAAQMILGRLMSRLRPSFSLPNSLDARDLSRDPEVVSAYENDPLVHDRISARLFVSCYSAGLWALEHASSLKLPLLIMHGGEDRITSLEASRRFAGQVARGCTFKQWEGCRHEIHNEPVKEELFSFVVDWLSDHIPAEG